MPCRVGMGWRDDIHRGIRTVGVQQGAGISPKPLATLVERLLWRKVDAVAEANKRGVSGGS